MKHTSPRTAQRGFSLIELLVGLGIGVFLIAGTLSVYQESQSAILTSERMARMQESGRYAISVIEQDIRAVGLWGMLNSTEYVAGRATPADPISIAVTSDCQANWAVNIDTPIEGSEDSNAYGASCLNGVGYVTNSDVLVLRYADHRDLTAGDLGVGGLYLRSDQTHAEIFSGTTLPTGFAADAQINEMRSTAYFVSSSSDADADVPSLRRAVIDNSGGAPTIVTEEVISGIEDMQVQYGVDLNNDGSANSYLGADLVANPNTIVSLRLWLRTRTAQPELGFSDDRTWLYSQTSFAPAGTSTTDDDAYRRAVVSKTIELRNRRTAIANGA
ncbi:MAG: PilW family protein [Gammaproteobacteria bacterium]